MAPKNLPVPPTHSQVSSSSSVIFRRRLISPPVAAVVVDPPTHVYSHLESNFATIFLPHLMAFCSASSVCTWMSCARASSSFLSLSRAEATSYKMTGKLPMFAVVCRDSAHLFVSELLGQLCGVQHCPGGLVVGGPGLGGGLISLTLLGTSIIYPKK